MGYFGGGGSGTDPTGNNAWTGTNSFIDTKFTILDDGDPTKILAFQAGSISAATTRTLTAQDANYIVAGTNLTNVFTLPQSFPDTVGAPSIRSAAQAATGLDFVAASNAIRFYCNGTAAVEVGSAWGVQLNGGYALAWYSGVLGSTIDTALVRPAPGVLKCITGASANAWFQNAGGRARASAQFDKVDTTLANVTGLTVNVAAGRTYAFQAVLFVDATVVGGTKYAIAGTATATAIIYEVHLLDNATNANTITSRQTALAGAAGQAGTLAGLCTINGLITVNAAGTLTVQFAQNAANGTSSVLIGSHMWVEDMP